MATVFGWKFCGVLVGLLCPWTWGLPTTGSPGLVLVDTANQTSCWTTTSVFEQDCYHAEPLSLDPYPLSDAMFNRSIPYTTPDLLFTRAFQRARKRGTLRVATLGGSVTVGHGCISPTGLKTRECAWPRRLELWLENKIQDFTVEVTNLARPGECIMSFLHLSLDKNLPTDLDVDIVIVDFGVNDAVIEKFNNDVDNVRVAHEELVRYVRNDMVHAPALLYVESFIPPARVLQAPDQALNVAEVHANVTRKYDIPMASFRHAVWPDISHPETADHIWGRGVHPDWQVHQLLADVAVYYLQKCYARFLKVYGPLSDESPAEIAFENFERRMGCLSSERSARIEFRHFMGRPPPEQLVSSVGWSIRTVGHGAGLIGFGNSSTPAVATFDVTCTGDKRLLDIEYLLSYEGMGTALVTVDSNDIGQGSRSLKIIDGLWSSQSSVPWFEGIPIPGDSQSVRVTITILSAENERANGSLFLDNGLDEGDVRGDRKFKLLSMQCC